MPELPEVEIITRGLAARLQGRTISSAWVGLPKLIQGDSRAFTQELVGLTIQGFRRRGKVMVWDLGPRLLGVHLKMTGRFSFAPPQEPVVKHTHLRLGLAGADFELRYQDTRQFGWFRLMPAAELAAWPTWAELGPDALAVGFDEFRDLFGRRRGRLKSLLLNQTFLAGLGNIYVDESLFRAGLHPLRLAETVRPMKQAELHRAITQVLEEAISWGGSTIATYQDAEGGLGYFQTRHRVYGRLEQPCVKCGNPVQRIVVGGRSTFFCPRCQPLK